MSKINSKQSNITRSNSKTTNKGNKQNNTNNINGSLNTLRVRRKELWFTISQVGNLSLDFDWTTYPQWFGKMANLYENYEMHEVRINWISSYSKLSTGSFIVSYNSNPNDQFSYEAAIMLAQQGARSCQVSSNGQITIPRNAFTKTPSKRPCRGQDSWIFELITKVEAQENAPIQVFIEYDVTFRVPQLSPETVSATFNNWSSSNSTTQESNGRARFVKFQGRDFLVIKKLLSEIIQIIIRCQAKKPTFKFYNGNSVREIFNAIAEGEEDTRDCSFTECTYETEYDQSKSMYKSSILGSTGGKIEDFPSIAKCWTNYSIGTQAFNTKVTNKQIAYDHINADTLLGAGPLNMLFQKGTAVVMDLGQNPDLIHSLLVSAK
uniref:Coat protein n=4 Tax=Statovirus TaxID=1964815 RepID=A0A1U9WUH1_9VIRU|nr:coat protein [Statovirus A4]